MLASCASGGFCCYLQQQRYGELRSGQGPPERTSRSASPRATSRLLPGGSPGASINDAVRSAVAGVDALNCIPVADGKALALTCAWP